MVLVATLVHVVTCLPFRKVPLTTQTLDQPVSDPACPASLAATVSRLSGRRDTASPGSSKTQCSHPRQTLAWKPSCERSLSPSMALSSVGTVSERPADAVEAAVEGRWVVYVAICASARPVTVRP